MSTEQVLDNIIINAVNVTLKEQVYRITKTPYDEVTSSYYYSVILANDVVLPVKIVCKSGKLLYFHSQSKRWRRLRI